MFTRTKDKLLEMWSEIIIFRDPLPYPPKGEKTTGLKDVGKAFLNDIKDALGKV